MERREFCGLAAGAILALAGLKEGEPGYEVTKDFKFHSFALVKDPVDPNCKLRGQTQEAVILDEHAEVPANKNGDVFIHGDKPRDEVFCSKTLIEIDKKRNIATLKEIVITRKDGSVEKIPMNKEIVDWDQAKEEIGRTMIPGEAHIAEQHNYVLNLPAEQIELNLVICGGEWPPPRKNT